ncbi:AMP-binding protein [Marinifilum sp. RC60d5]|uniref:AMP-binding protein n=1 Tax=Marinifilum sp. RC60d5 TaxID=3458414 RepID=UPI0040369E3B
MNSELTINGIHYNKEELSIYCDNIISNSLNEWECDYCRFIQEWMNNSDFVHAKTSGSTGVPKQIILSKQKMINSARLTGEFFEFSKRQTALLCLSTNFIAGKMMLVRAFEWQLNLIPVEPNGHPLKYVSRNIDFAAMIPLQVKNSLSENSGLEHIKNLLIGGGAVDNHLEDSLQLLKTHCFVGYGMTETVSHVALRSLNGPNKSASYYAMGNAEFSTDNRGCLCISSPLIVEQKLLTNDMVELISKKEFKWLGRFDNVINSGGIKLFPEQIEAKLQDLIEEPFFLAGIPDNHLGEKLILLIESPTAEARKKEELIRQIKSLFDKFEQAREIFYVPKFKRTLTGKIQREVTLLTSKLSR